MSKIHFNLTNRLTSQKSYMNPDDFKISDIDKNIQGYEA